MVSSVTEAASKLPNFIMREMRMPHIYQPVVLVEILGSNGCNPKLDVHSLAEALDNPAIGA